MDIEKDLCTSDLTIGCVYTCDLGGRIDLNRSGFPGTFLTSFPELDTVTDLDKGILDKEHFGLNALKLKMRDLRIDKLILSSGIQVDINDNANMYLSVYPIGICSMILSIDIKQRLNTDKIIEIVGLINNSEMKEHKRAEQQVIITSNKSTFDSFEGLFLWLETLICGACFRIPTKHMFGVCSRNNTYCKEATSDYSSHRLNRYPNSYLCPVVFIKSTDGSENTSDDLIHAYKRQLAGIKHLWIKKWRFLKTRLVDEDIEQENHPLQYGLTYFSPICTIEIHPRLVNDAAIIGERTIAEHYFAEWYLLSRISHIQLANLGLI